MGEFYEFFAGGGMARAGLGDRWACTFANDIDEKKSAIYELNWGKQSLKTVDVDALSTANLPGHADLAWASFPCQDLSLAGAGAGLEGERSGVFWSFWRLMAALGAEGRPPPLIVLENVCGALTSNEGRDFATIGEVLVNAGYRFGAIVMDAVHFVPQSRPRLFIIAVRQSAPIPKTVSQSAPEQLWSSSALLDAYRQLAAQTRAHWIWWRLPAPPIRNIVLSDLIEEEPTGVGWNTAEETDRLISLMSGANLKKVRAAQVVGRQMIGAVYKRTRQGKDGKSRQRAEVRFDNVAGCLRTPTGGSSRQTIMVVEGRKIRSRLLSVREAARLMGLPDDYQLPENYNEGYHLVGDGLVVPVVRHLAEGILDPLLDSIKGSRKENVKAA